MTAQPTVNGRFLPHNDFEGDDFTPGAGGAFVTCQDTGGGRMLAFATNGKVDLDGKTIRAAIEPHDAGGVSLPQVAAAINKLSHRTLIIPTGWSVAHAEAWLRAGNGVMVDGYYGAIERAYRSQANADFNHQIWWSHISPTSGARMWDPLNPDVHAFGRWVPIPVFRAFAGSLAWAEKFGYIALEPLPPKLSPPTVPGTVPSGTHVTV